MTRVTFIDSYRHEPSRYRVRRHPTKRSISGTAAIENNTALVPGMNTGGLDMFPVSYDIGRRQGELGFCFPVRPVIPSRASVSADLRESYFSTISILDAHHLRKDAFTKGTVITNQKTTAAKRPPSGTPILPRT